MNAPERFNTWRWEDEDDAKRVAYEPDTKLPNAGRTSSSSHYYLPN